MEPTAKRRLALFGGGVLLTAGATAIVQLLLDGRGVVDAEPYAVVVGLGVGMPLLLAGAYPALSRVDRLRTRALLALGESGIGTAMGVGTVALLLTLDVASMLTVGSGAAATYLGGTAARALVLGREAVDGDPR
ncbi:MULTISPECIES: hypothetical protein [Halolamina]|uniref:Uncharacterized protein n=1 Tax=Halolamina pelagica TaxID=699431 RepID=A0A1I5P4R8_9EURY|nr:MULTISPECIES: hypothetical protein [Halolamina]NHX36631.1 hypothetical protein [Halolamina sp. R1-12]SFP29072.1 hypothetical protein SAMN05216277_102353 [Halolamina pelagica]